MPRSRQALPGHAWAAFMDRVAPAHGLGGLVWKLLTEEKRQRKDLAVLAIALFMSVGKVATAQHKRGAWGDPCPCQPAFQRDSPGFRTHKTPKRTAACFWHMTFLEQERSGRQLVTSASAESALTSKRRLLGFPTTRNRSCDGRIVNKRNGS